MNANVTPAGDQDLWSLFHDLVFGSPHPVVVSVECAIALLLAIGAAGVVRRIWSGDRIAAGPLSLDRPHVVRRLEASLEALSRDDRLKANVLWMFRERLNEASGIVFEGIEPERVREWSAGVLTDILSALSEGGHDRHRASLWIDDGDALRMFNGVGFRQAAVDGATLPRESIAGNVLRTGNAYTTRDVAADRTFCPKPRSGRPYASLLAVPVKTPAGLTIAALCVDAESRGYFDADAEFFAACFGDLLALLLAQIVTGAYT